MAATGAYNLDLDNQKRNVFVTQLHERDDEDDIQAFPVVKETGGKLLETGINTLQKTLLLKKQVEVDQVDLELHAKRQEFRQKMELCKQKQSEILKRQQQMKEEFANCEKYIKDYDAKRRRAIQKYQTELKLKEQKTKEYEMLCEQMAELKERQKHLENMVNKYQIYEDFLLKVIDIMPEDYIAATDDKVKGIMMRHRTLSESSQALIDKLESAGDEMKNLRYELDELKAEHDKMKLSINSKLAQLQHSQEHKEERNKQEEQSFAANKGNMRDKRTEFGVIMMAIDNIAEKCLKVLDPNLENLTLEQKLRKIGEHLVEREDVARMAQKGDASSTVKESSKGSADIKKKIYHDNTISTMSTSQTQTHISDV